MNDILRSLDQALRLIAAGDANLAAIIALSLRVTGLALLVSTLGGVPLGAVLGLGRVRLRGVVTALLYTGMGLPPVVVGLFVYLMLSRSGPLGAWGWLFTPNAMIAAQTIIAFPVATPSQEAWAVLMEARIGVVAAIVAAFGSIISEVGAVMLVGGNIAGKTRVLTTAIVLETRQGDFSLALALGVILLALAFAANLILLRLQGRD
jgi:tungstate transport system permease protein